MIRIKKGIRIIYCCAICFRPLRYRLHVKVFDVNGASLPYPAESDETVPAICPLSIVRPVETVMISSMTEDTVYLQRVSDQTALTDLNAKLFEKYETEGEQEKAVVEPGKFYAAKSAQFEAWYRYVCRDSMMSSWWRCDVQWC